MTKLSFGVGTELRLIFSRIGIPGCGDCTEMESALNLRGPIWCEQNFNRLITWLLSQAASHKVSLVRAAWRLLFVEPRLAAKIAWLKLRYPLTGLAELAAVGIVDHAINLAGKASHG